MKTRRIPETDLARIAVLPREEQPAKLQLLKGFRPPHTLNPFRKAVPDLVNLQYDMLGVSDPTHWCRIEEAIIREGKHESEIERNLQVARALFEYCRDHEVVSYYKPQSSWGVGFGQSVSYWYPFYSVWDGRAAFVFFDPRKASPLTAEARRFVFSLMHQRLRVDDPDFADADLVAVRFGSVKDSNARTVKPYSAEGVSLFSLDELTEMIDTTYRLWFEELDRRAEETRRRAAGGKGNPMGF